MVRAIRVPFVRELARAIVPIELACAATTAVSAVKPVGSKSTVLLRQRRYSAQRLLKRPASCAPASVVGRAGCRRLQPPRRLKDVHCSPFLSALQSAGGPARVGGSLDAGERTRRREPSGRAPRRSGRRLLRSIAAPPQHRCNDDRRPRPTGSAPHLPVGPLARDQRAWFPSSSVRGSRVSPS